ncbi:hypothetical protein Sgri01_06713 [Streptomyces griseus]
MPGEREERAVRGRVDHRHPVEERPQARGLDPGRGARVQREDNAQRSADRAQLAQHRAQRGRVVGVLRAVHGRQHVAVRFQTEAAEQSRAFPPRREVVADRLHDGVSGHRDPLVADAFGQQQRPVLRGRRAQDVGQPVDDHPVVLLGHRTVVAAQPRLDVDQRDRPGVGHEGAGEGRVGVALDDDRERRLGGESLVERGQSRRDLHGSGLPAHTGQILRFGETQLVEEGAGQRVVVVLSGVHDPGGGAEQADELGELDQLGTGTEDDGDRTICGGSHDPSFAGHGCRNRCAGVARRLLNPFPTDSGPWSRYFVPEIRGPSPCRNRPLPRK